MTDVAIHTSTFDMRGVFTITVPEIAANVQPLSIKTPIKISTVMAAYAQPIQHTKTHIGITISPKFALYAEPLTYDIGRGDCRFNIPCYAPSMMIKVIPGIPDTKSIEFGEFKFSYAKRNGPDKVTVDVDERFARFGVNEPKNYTRKIVIAAESEEYSEYGALQQLYGLRRTLNVYGFPYPDSYISNLSELQRKPGLARWVWDVEFTYHHFESVDNAIIDGMTLPTVISVSEEKKTAILDELYVREGFDEPIGYMSSRVVEFVDFHGECASQLDSRIGKSITTNINGAIRERVKISNITSWSPKGGGNVKIFQIELQWYIYNTTDTVSFGNIVLSNPFFPNAHDISPEYSVDMSAGINLANVIPVITTRYAVQALTESNVEVEALVSAIGTKQTLTINGREIPLCYISQLSKLQPRGGGTVWKYTIEFSKRQGENPISVTFDGISLPNATAAGEEGIEILSSRTVLKNGKTSVAIGLHPSRRFTFTCLANDKTVYNQIYARIGQKKALIVDGETIPKAYVSNISGNRRIGGGTTRLYVWVVDFEEETA